MRIIQRRGWFYLLKEGLLILLKYTSVDQFERDHVFFTKFSYHKYLWCQKKTAKSDKLDFGSFVFLVCLFSSHFYLPSLIIPVACMFLSKPCDHTAGFFPQPPPPPGCCLGKCNHAQGIMSAFPPTSGRLFFLFRRILLTQPDSHVYEAHMIADDFSL